MQAVFIVIFQSVRRLEIMSLQPVDFTLFFGFENLWRTSFNARHKGMAGGVFLFDTIEKRFRILLKIKSAN